MPDDLIKVTMNLSSDDVVNAERVRRDLGLSSNASAVSAALQIHLSLLEILDETGGELMVFYPAQPARSEKFNIGNVAT